MRPGIAILLSTAMLALLLAFLFAAKRVSVNRGDGASGHWDDGIEAFVRRRVADTYVDELSKDQALEAFYRAMDAYVDFDVYCDFIPPSEHKKWKEDTSGRYAGLGVKINQVEEGLEVIGVFPGGPAAKAGIRIGDTIVRAGGTNLRGRHVDDITKLLKGAPRSSVPIGIIRGPRPDEGPATGDIEVVSVQRGVITPPSVFTRRVGPNGAFLQIRLTDFTEETAEAFDKTMSGIGNGEPVQGILLDFRHNGGGVLGVAVRIADRFLRKGRLIVRMEGRGTDATKDYAASNKKGKLLEMPLVVLVNEWSASASEVVAGALQDHRRAVLVGVRTYGKFLVQSITEIPGKQAAVKLTTSRYYTPSGRSYQGPSHAKSRKAGERPRGAGLVPDVVIELSDDDRKSLLEFWSDEEGKPWGEVRQHPELGDDWIDPQLERALKLLQGDIVMQKIQRGRRARRRNG